MWVFSSTLGQDSKTRLYRVTILQIPDHTISKYRTRYLKRSVLRCFLAPIVFVLFETILSWGFCVHSHNLHGRIQTFEDTTLNLWKYIHNEAIQVRVIIILLYFLSNGVGVGEHAKTSYLNRKCRTAQCTIIHPGQSRWTYGNSGKGYPLLL